MLFLRSNELFHPHNPTLSDSVDSFIPHRHFDDQPKVVLSLSAVITKPTATTLTKSHSKQISNLSQSSNPPSPLRTVPRVATRLTSAPRLAPKAFFSSKDIDNLIPSDDEGRQTGRRGAELEWEKKGVDLYNRDPIMPPSDQGTYENPVLVPSGDGARTVGFVDPATHAIYWFNLAKGKVHFIKVSVELLHVGIVYVSRTASD